MPLLFNTNIASLSSQRNLRINTEMLEKAMDRLASGQKVKRSADDATGLYVSESLIDNTRGANKAMNNIQDGLGAIQIAEGGLSIITESLQRIRELVVQASNDSNSTTQRTSIAREIRFQIDDINRIAQSANFNGVSLLDGSVTSLLLQIGSDSNLATSTLDITSAFASAQADAGAPINGIGIIDSVGGTTTFASLNAIYNPATGLSTMTTSALAQSFLGDIDAALDAVNDRRAALGSFQNQLESITGNLTLSVENMEAANSRIRDTDIASESSKMTNAQILQQAATIVLSQANQQAASVLSLLEQR